MNRGSVRYKVVLAALVGLIAYVSPASAERVDDATAFATCFFCVGGDATCQQPLTGQVCEEFCPGGPNPQHCAYDSAPACSWDEIALTCGSGKVE